MLILIDLDGTLINTVHPEWKPYKDRKEGYNIDAILSQVPVFPGAKEFISSRKNKGDHVVVVSDSHFRYLNPICNILDVECVSLADKPNTAKLDEFLNANGLIISEFFPRQKEDKYTGSKASRIQAGLSHGLILVQSKVEGGSKYTLEKFVKLGRPLGIIHFPTSEEYNTDVFGANRLIIEKGKEGLAQMLDLKKISSINVKKILAFTCKSDYDSLIDEIEYKPNNLF